MSPSDSSIPTDKLQRQRLAVILFIIIALIMVAAVISGLFLEESLLAKVMHEIQYNRIPIGEVHPSVMGRVSLFAFGLPLGLVALFGCSLLLSKERSSKIRLMILWGFLIFSLVILVPKIFGREIGDLYFGTGGFIILGAIIASFWFWAKYRSNLNAVLKSAADFKALGYLCFGIAAWQICGFSAAPGFALFPDEMLQYGVRPFAIGQAKAIMAYFVFGWIFTAIGFYKSSSANNK